MLCKFEVGYKSTKATKNISCVKDEGTVNHSTQKRGYKKSCSACKNLNNQASSALPKTMDSKTVFQAYRISVKLGTSQSSVVCHVHKLGKKKHLEQPNCTSHYQNIAKL